jgi:hypothetical protein
MGEFMSDHSIKERFRKGKSGLGERDNMAT